MINWMQVFVVSILLNICGVAAFAEEIPQQIQLNRTIVKASDTQVRDFRADNYRLFTSNPVGGLQLAGQVKDLVLADRTLVDLLLKAALSAKSVQASAVGSGIGQAVKQLSIVDKGLADEIGLKIAASGSSDILTGYAQAISDVQTLAVANAASSIGGGGVGGAITSQITSTSLAGRTNAPGSFFATNLVQSYSFSGASLTCTSSVSPSSGC